MDDAVSPAVTDMLERGLLRELDAEGLEAFLAEAGLGLLFFTGGKRRAREAHDIAVALREILREYPQMVQVAVLEPDLEADQQQRFRVLTAPSLVFIAAGNTLEVIPGVRDWADYASAFHRYLGEPPREASA